MKTVLKTFVLSGNIYQDGKIQICLEGLIKSMKISDFYLVLDSKF